MLLLVSKFVSFYQVQSEDHWSELRILVLVVGPFIHFSKFLTIYHPVIFGSTNLMTNLLKPRIRKERMNSIYEKEAIQLKL